MPQLPSRKNNRTTKSQAGSTYMKTNSRLTNRAGSRRNQGFTLIEMIGVLAVIAILAAVLVPKVFEAINNSRINNTAMSCQTVKTAIIDHFAKFGSLAAGVTTPPVAITAPTNNYDGYLLQEAFLDKPFAVKIGDGLITTQIELDTADAGTQAAVAPATATVTTHTAGQAAFNLDGVGA